MSYFLIEDIPAGRLKPGPGFFNKKEIETRGINIVYYLQKIQNNRSKSKFTYALYRFFKFPLFSNC